MIEFLLGGGGVVLLNLNVGIYIYIDIIYFFLDWEDIESHICFLFAPET